MTKLVTRCIRSFREHQHRSKLCKYSETSEYEYTCIGTYWICTVLLYFMLSFGCSFFYEFPADILYSKIDYISLKVSAIFLLKLFFIEVNKLVLDRLVCMLFVIFENFFDILYPILKYNVYFTIMSIGSRDSFIKTRFIHFQKL